MPCHAPQRCTSLPEEGIKGGGPAHPVPFPAPSLLETSGLRKEQYPGTSPTSVLNAPKASSLSAPPGQWLVIWHAWPYGGCGAAWGVGTVTGLTTRDVLCEIFDDAGACSEVCVWLGREEALLVIMSVVGIATPTICVAPRAAARGAKAVYGFIVRTGQNVGKLSAEMEIKRFSSRPVALSRSHLGGRSLFQCTKCLITYFQSESGVRSTQRGRFVFLRRGHVQEQRNCPMAKRREHLSREQ